jgi:hypothetical protein
MANGITLSTPPCTRPVDRLLNESTRQIRVANSCDSGPILRDHCKQFFPAGVLEFGAELAAPGVVFRWRAGRPIRQGVGSSFFGVAAGVPILAGLRLSRKRMSGLGLWSFFCSHVSALRVRTARLRLPSGHRKPFVSLRSAYL